MLRQAGDLGLVDAVEALRLPKGRLSARAEHEVPVQAGAVAPHPEGRRAELHLVLGMEQPLHRARLLELDAVDNHEIPIADDMHVALTMTAGRYLRAALLGAALIPAAALAGGDGFASAGSVPRRGSGAPARLGRSGSPAPARRNPARGLPASARNPLRRPIWRARAPPMRALTMGGSARAQAATKLAKMLVSGEAARAIRRKPSAC